MRLEENLNELLKFIDNMEDKDKAKFEEIVEKIKDLDYKHKIKLLKTIGSDVNRILKQIEQKKIEEKCKNEGHTFSEWKYFIDKKTVVGGDLGDRQKFMIDEKRWERTCLLCGFKEIVYKEPECVKNIRLKKEKQERIKQLKKELKSLQNK